MDSTCEPPFVEDIVSRTCEGRGGNSLWKTGASALAFFLPFF